MTRTTTGRGARALGALQAGVGLATFAFPRRGAELAGMSWGDATGEALLGWRNMNLALQPADLALFAHAYVTRSVPRRTATIAVAAALFALGSLVADSRGARRRNRGDRT